MDGDLIPLAELVNKTPADLLKKYRPEAIRRSVRQEMIAQEVVRERHLQRVKEIHAQEDEFTREWLADEFEWQHPEFRRACMSLEALKRLFVLVEKKLEGK